MVPAAPAAVLTLPFYNQTLYCSLILDCILKVLLHTYTCVCVFRRTYGSKPVTVSWTEHEIYEILILYD